MKYLISIILIIGLGAAKSKAQKVSVEKSVWGIQTLMLPLSVYNEAKLTNSIALRSELSWGFSWSGGGFSGYYNYSNDNNSTNWSVIPYINIEPRYYYNLGRRSRKGKRIDGNSGNYLSLLAGSQPGFGITSKNVELFPMVYIIPTYGLRRNIGKHFNFEAAFGIGRSWEFIKYDSPNFKKQRYTNSETIYNIRLAFGFIF